MRRQRVSTGLFAAFLAILSVAVASPAISANLIATPKISLEERWDSNIQNASADEISDFVSRATPRLTFTIETYRAQLNLTGGFDYERYSKHTELNERAAAFYDLSTTRPLQFSQRFSLQPSVRFAETNDPVRRNVLTQTPIPGLPPSETIVTARTKTREYSGSLQFSYLLTPNVVLELGGGGTKRSFLDNDAGTVDSDTVSGNTSISYRFTPRFSSGIYFSASRNTFENDTDSRTYNLGLSMNYLLSEHFTFDARAGANHLKETTTTGEDTVTSPSGQISLTYDWREFKAVLLGSYELAGGGSFGVTTRRGNILLTLSDRFAPRWWWDLSGSYQINRSPDTPRTEDVSTWHGNAGLRYQAAEWASFRLAGALVRQRARNSIEAADLDRNSIALVLDLSKDYKLF
jgi:hypothetical protein